MLHKILLIAKRDYRAIVMRKAFLIGLVVAPLLFGGGIFGLALVRVTQNNKDRHVAMIDHTGIAAAAVIEAVQAKDGGSRNATTPDQFVVAHYVIESLDADNRDPKGQRLALSERVRRGELFAFIEIGSEVLHPSKDTAAGRVAYYSNAGGVDPSRQWLAGAINTGLRHVRLVQLGIDPSHFDEVLKPIPVESMSLTSRDEKTGKIGDARTRNEFAGFAVPLVLTILMMMVVMLGAAPMISAVAEDKIQRVYEMLLATATPLELVAGKVLAAVGCSLTSSVFYVLGAILALQGMALGGVIPFGVLPWFFVYLIAEVTMLGALGTALGAACNTPRDAQQLTGFMIMPVMLPVILMAPLAQQPNGPFAIAMSFIPPFTPFTMIMRQAMPGGVPAWQPWVGLIGVLAFAVLITWAAARIFRVAILLQGKPPNVAELVRWAVRG